MRLARLNLRTVALLVALTAIPLTAPGCGSALSREQEIALGEQNAPQFLKQGGGEVPSPEVQTYVSQIGQKIVKQIKPEQERDLPWEFHVINSPEINAFALPGGKVFISRGLLEKMNNEAQLAAVLGHEVGHVVAQHIGKQMSQQMGLELGLGVIGAVTDTQWAQVLGGVGGQLYLLRFSRSQETEADDIGMTYMVRAGYNPVAMTNVHQILMEAAGGGGAIDFLSTHPDPQARYEAARARIQREYQFTQNNPQYVLNEQAFQARALAPLRKLPPAPRQSMRELIPEAIAHAGCTCGGH